MNESAADSSVFDNATSTPSIKRKKDIDVLKLMRESCFSTTTSKFWAGLRNLG